MPFSFPPSPTVGQQSAQNGRVYSWTGRVWRLVSAVLASHASTHGSGGSDAISIAASQVTSGTLAAARLPVATTTTAGGVIVPTSGNLSVDGSGKISATFSTLTQAQAGDSATFSTPLRVRDQLVKWKLVDFQGGLSTTANGGLSYGGNGSSWHVASYSTAGGSALIRTQNDLAFSFSSYYNTLYSYGNYWARPQAFSLRGIIGVGSSNGVCRIQFGKLQTTTTVGRMANSGIGLEFVYNNSISCRITLLAHDGTTLRTQNTGITLESYADFLLFTDGAGNVTVVVNDGATTNTSVGSYTMTGAPTSGGMSAIVFEASNGGDTSSSSIQFSRYVWATANGGS